MFTIADFQKLLLTISEFFGLNLNFLSTVKTIYYLMLSQNYHNSELQLLKHLPENNETFTYKLSSKM